VWKGEQILKSFGDWPDARNRTALSVKVGIPLFVETAFARRKKRRGTDFGSPT
jgi:hypothetical protein